jgi:tRNA pseudouridine55 synthase
MDGLLVVDKPVGPTSHDVVARIRRALGERRIGHTGTLDPAASGVLALVLGRATRLARFMAGDRKHYDALVRLGVATDTYDAEGAPTGARYEGPWPGAATVEEALQGFRGSFLQRPPAYSAKKIAGRRSYDIARKQKQLDEPSQALEPVSVSVAALSLTGYDNGLVRLTVDCSAGFYVRSLAHDLGERLGTGAHLAALRRTRSGAVTLEEARPLAAIEDDPQSARQAMVPMAGMLSSMASVTLTAEGAQRAIHGCILGPADYVAGSGDDPLQSVFAVDEAPTDVARLAMAHDPLLAAPPAQGAPPERAARPVGSVAAVRHVRLLSPDGELVGMAETISGTVTLHPCVVLM